MVEGAAALTTMRAPRKTLYRAQRLRRTLSAPEVQLWLRLRERASGKPIFRRQHPIGPYVLDFPQKHVWRSNSTAPVTIWAITRSATSGEMRG
jgi:hypothetical protein